MKYETEIKPALVNLMINIKDKAYTSEDEKNGDLSYNLALSEALLKLKQTEDFLERTKEIGKELL